MSLSSREDWVDIFFVVVMSLSSREDWVDIFFVVVLKIPFIFNFSLVLTPFHFIFFISFSFKF